MRVFESAYLLLCGGPVSDAASLGATGHRQRRPGACTIGDRWGHWPPYGRRHATPGAHGRVSWLSFEPVPRTGSTAMLRLGVQQVNGELRIGGNGVTCSVCQSPQLLHDRLSRHPRPELLAGNGTGQMTRSAHLCQPPRDWVLAVPCGGLTAVTAQVCGVQVLSRPPGTWRCGGTATLPRSSKGGDSRMCANGPAGSAISRSSVSTACLPICSAGTSAALTCG